MAKFTPNTIAGTYDVTQINNNFQQIATELNDKVLYRNNPVGEANQVQTDIDLNGKRILNLPEPIGQNEPARKADLFTPEEIQAYIDEAEAAATAAQESEEAAAASAGASAASASAAATSAASAASDAATVISQTSIATAAASSASSSASTATNQASIATSAASTATSASSTATTAAGTATTQATNASTSATNAASSASAAAASAASIVSDAASVAALYDSFDDRYLGAKASNPTVDNDGNALLTGALYWNTTNNLMMVYTGSAWVNSNSTIAGPASITANSASPALTITQTGSGHALLVEDSASPDTTPFVVLTDGRVVAGYTDTPVTGASVTVQGTASGLAVVRYTDTSNLYPYLNHYKSRGSTVGTPSIVQSGDGLGRYTGYGYDGSGYIPAAEIKFDVDGAPGTNDMPGRIIFSTTADGTNSPTERMRIDNAGRVNVNTNGWTDAQITVGGALQGFGISPKVIHANPTIGSDATLDTTIFRTAPSTAASAFTLPVIYHFAATQGTIGATSTLTTQSGFYAGATLTGATNNYGFFGNIASGTGRWNLYMAGTAKNYLAGTTLIGSTTDNGTDKLQVTGSASITASSGTALTVTNTGAGNSFVVEDATSPDSTPFVIDASGNVMYGTTTTDTYAGNSAKFLGVSDVHVFHRKANDTSGVTLHLAKTRGSAYEIGQSGDTLGLLCFTSADGSANIRAAEIRGAIDGTPGSNDMPGRLVFSTTADGASSPTEAMRIDSAQQIGIGGTPQAGRSFSVVKNMTGSTTGMGIASRTTVQSDVTGFAYLFNTAASTQATAFTLGSLYHYYASQGTIGAGSSVTNQYGMFIDSSLTGATNNYGFYGNIASGTNRWNLYMNGTASNYIAGSVGIGTTSLTGYNLKVDKGITGATTARGISVGGTVQTDVTAEAIGIQTNLATSPAFTLPDLTHFSVNQGTLAGTVTRQYGYYVSSGMTGAGSNYAFRSDIAAGANRYNLYMNGTADNYLAGSLGIGITPTTGMNVTIAANITGATTANSVYSLGIIQSDVTSIARYFRTDAQTAAGSYTVGTIAHYSAGQATFGAGSTVTNQYGFHIGASLIGATNNYGIYADIPSGSNRWNIYAVGTASNYFAGDMQFDKTVTAAGTTGSQTINKNAGSVNFAAGTSSVTVTNSRVTTNSIIVACVATNDPTLHNVYVKANAGSFDIYGHTSATNETRVNFIIIN